jgi:hypothetical protein
MDGVELVLRRVGIFTPSVADDEEHGFTEDGHGKA